MWLKVSSVCNLETYQSNRLNLKYKTRNDKNVLVYALNGSALAFPLVVETFLELNFINEKNKY